MASLSLNYDTQIEDYALDSFETPQKLNEELAGAFKKLRPSEETRIIIDIYAKLLLPSMKRHRTEVCRGCQYEDPSQLTHDAFVR